MRKQIKPIDFTPFSWIENEQDLQTAIGEINQCISQGCRALAVDLEYHQVERKAIVLCLMQLSTFEKDYIIDSLVLRDKVSNSGLKNIMEDPSVVKIFHGSESDI